jgi:molybdopterin-guanine dinucleotide biosynthesis protein A
MSDRPSAAGVVLAGGRSARMGAPKAALPWDGSTLLARACAALAGVTGRVIVVASPGGPAAPVPDGVEVVEDRVAGRGPLEGIAAGLGAAARTHEAAVVVAVDLPAMGPALAARLLAGLEGGAEAAVPLVSGRAQVLAAAYRTSLAARARELAEAGERRAGALLDGRRVAWLGEVDLLADPALRAADPTLEGLRDIDTPAEMMAARVRRALT